MKVFTLILNIKIVQYKKAKKAGGTRSSNKTLLCKDLVSRDENLFMGPRLNLYFLCYALMVSQFWVNFFEKILNSIFVGIYTITDQHKTLKRLSHRYGVRSPKFIWAPCAQLYSLAETPQTPHTPHLGSWTRALLVNQDRRHLFLTP